MAKKKATKKNVETLTHDEAKRKNIPTAEYQSVLQKQEQNPVRVAYERRNRDLDPQLVWRGKDDQDWSDLVVHAPPLYIQEKVHPKVLIDDLLRSSRESEHQAGMITPDLFADFNGIPKGVDKTEFYQHDQNWSNRMILGDSLQVMASLAEREGLRGKVQCIYIDPPYGIKFNSNFQWSTTSRDVKDGNQDHITREPEQVKAFRDTWRDGIHSYLTYLRDRLTVARDLLTDSGSIFVQIGDENVHRVRALMDEIFGEENFVSQIVVSKTGSQTGVLLGNIADLVLWYAKDSTRVKYRQLFGEREFREENDFSPDPLKSSGNSTGEEVIIKFEGKPFSNGSNEHWKTNRDGMERLKKADRIVRLDKSIRFKRFYQDYPAKAIYNLWTDLGGATDMIYVVQTATRLVARCLLMATDPSDIVLDPTCGSGTTAYVAEQWGRRWITIDTSRVALALARARIMGARYPYYLLADSPEGQMKEAEITRTAPSTKSTRNDIRHGFVYERVPHITLKSIANNTEIDVIWDKYQEILEPLREQLNKSLKQKWEEWEIPRDITSVIPENPKDLSGTQIDKIKKLHANWWKNRITRQKEIDASIAAKAEYEYLYDKPYEDNKIVRVAGPFTVESLSPHRVLGVDENDELVDPVAETKGEYGEERSFVQMILDNLKTAGVQQAHKEDKINFTSLTPWPGDLICAEAKYLEHSQPSPSGRGEGEGGVEKRAAIFIGPEFGTVTRPDLVAAAREAGDADFDVLITCAFSYDAHSSEFDKLGRIPVLKARMNADLHMADDLKNTGKGNLFVIFGEPDIDILPAKDGKVQVKINGVDVFHPNTGEVRSDGAEGIACWFIDTDYNEESFFVRHAYFLGANDPYKSLKTTLKAEINEDAWATLNSDTSRPFDKPKSGRIAVKVINHLGDEVMKVFKI
jgi:adenine-specific DNA-methyltransferase